LHIPIAIGTFETFGVNGSRLFQQPQGWGGVKKN
jgi:hypothetical protein